MKFPYRYNLITSTEVLIFGHLKKNIILLRSPKKKLSEIIHKYLILTLK